MLSAIISETTPQGATGPGFKFAINSTIVQHVVPNSQLNKSAVPAPKPEESSTTDEPAAAKKGEK